MRRIILKYKNVGFVECLSSIIYKILTKLKIKKQLREFKELKNQSINEIQESIYNLIASDLRNAKFIDFFHIPMGWNTPLFQRFQHFSLIVQAIGGVSFYGSHPFVDQNVITIKKIQDGLYIVNIDDQKVKQALINILSAISCKKILRLQSIDLATSTNEINEFYLNGYDVLYEYIDEISSDITGFIPNFVVNRHHDILSNEKYYVVATSEKLYKEVAKLRTKNFIYSCNGVTVDHWSTKLSDEKAPEEIKKFFRNGKVNIGYHGALAKWIDYDLLRLIANSNQYNLILIGYEHDDSFEKSNLRFVHNIYFLGSKNYFTLNQYSSFYDIGILPFIRTELTDSVSPVKIFEYMATGIPVVTSDLPECQKYKSCLISRDQSEFMLNLSRACVLKKDPIYQSLLSHDAANNSWLNKIKSTVSMIVSGI